MDETKILYIGKSIRIPDKVLHKFFKPKWWMFIRKYKLWKVNHDIKVMKKKHLFLYIEIKEQKEKMLKEVEHFLAYGDEKKLLPD